MGVHCSVAHRLTVTITTTKAGEGPGLARASLQGVTLEALLGWIVSTTAGWEGGPFHCSLDDAVLVRVCRAAPTLAVEPS